MTREKTGDQQVRKIQKTGSDGGSYMITIPKDYIKQLGWREGQKLVVKKRGKTISIADWQSK